LKCQNAFCDLDVYVALGELKEPKAVEPLIKMLGDEQWIVRLAAARSLGEINDAKATGPLVKALADKDAAVRVQAALSLGRIRDKKAIEPLIQVLRDRVQGVVEAAAEALESIGKPALEPVKDALGREKDGQTKATLKEVIEEIEKQ